MDFEYLFFFILINLVCLLSFTQNTGNYPIYRIPSAKKGPGFEFLADQNGKNDYDALNLSLLSKLVYFFKMDRTHTYTRTYIYIYI